ncbi:MAG TPA: hypothetical protein VHT91_47545 [Kofleriaceae bacterium]|jgi:hypothetical protein|nr:hypothetical protein [Kofleriaceae bacterium]
MIALARCSAAWRAWTATRDSRASVAAAPAADARSAVIDRLARFTVGLTAFAAHDCAASAPCTHIRSTTTGIA